ncbi:EamA family transporter [Gemmatimonadota bacterium]
MLSNSTPPAYRHRILVILAYGVIWIIWGSMFYALSIALEVFPPLLVVASRTIIAGALLLTFVKWLGHRVHLSMRHIICGGVLLFLFGSGSLALGMREMNSGVSAVTWATMPLWTVLILRIIRESSPSRREILGTIIGFLGIVLLYIPWKDSIDSGINIWGAICIALSAFSWAAGTVYIRKVKLTQKPLQATALLLLAGGTATLIVAAASGSINSINSIELHTESLLALAYLTIFGSLLGFWAYSWLLNQTSPQRLVSYAFINPVVAVLLGWFLAGEPVSLHMLCASAFTVGGVALVVLSPMKTVPLTNKSECS